MSGRATYLRGASALALALIAGGLWTTTQAGAGSAPSTQASAPAAAVAGKPLAKRPVLISGEVTTIDAQSIFVPPSNSSPVTLRTFVAEGTVVKAGELVLQIETPNAANVRQLEIEAEQAAAKTERDCADLEVKAVEAEKALATAMAALARARVEAALPKLQITALDYDRYQAERDRSERDLEVKKQAFSNATEAVARRRADGDLEKKKMLINVAYSEARLALSEVRAARDGVVIHGYNQWRGERYEEGSSAYPGNAAGQVMGIGPVQVRAWALEADRGALAEGQSVRLGFDALPGVTINGKVVKIASAPESRASWGNGRYFPIDVTLPDNHGVALVPGMSVLIEPLGAARAAEKNPPPAAVELAIEGEILSRASTPISPPSIRYIWQYTLGQMVPEGTLVKAGQPVATFQTQEVTLQLATKGSTLKEKLRALEKLKLDQVEASKSADLAVAEAQSNAEKAARKATQPKELIRRVDYDKLVIDRGLQAQLATLTVRQSLAQARARKAELAGLTAEIAQLQNGIDILEKGQKALTVLAPKAGMVLYKANSNGEKTAIGGQVWVGSSIATLADPEQLYVNAKVPEAQAAKVHIGQRARINVPGANLALAARVSALGRTYHGKSSSQPIVVRDIELQFDAMPKGYKPGTAVQATLLPDGAPAAASATTAASGKESGK